MSFTLKNTGSYKNSVATLYAVTCGCTPNQTANKYYKMLKIQKSSHSKILVFYFFKHFAQFFPRALPNTTVNAIYVCLFLTQ